ncbi:MAG: hypothetical protein IT467_06780 [Dokdonella sp.]|uniref:hypothetical protein n=1 Tax=Dokdonella sp. TaxID=2291710 RepID=UPI0025B9C9BF|nr:hypothetical protein [Dokdonella sp.]MBZ0223035.1 hypothetical protein [Dokdonella sp.]MCC7255623.1 hypothetical protein [Dokdonella sp.]
MIPGILNTLLSFALVYFSILNLPMLKENPWYIVIAGVLIIVLALWSRAGDLLKWFSTVTILLGAMLAAFGIWNLTSPFADLFVFWFVFWTGALVGVIALWDALYRPRAQTSAA